MTGLWTLNYLREWSTRLTFRSLLHYRSFLLRERVKRLSPGALLRLTMKDPIRETIWLREVGSDVPTFDEILVKQVYRPVIEALGACQYIVDLGGNIGLASLYFAHRFPYSKILTVEPDPRNYAVLTRNTQRLVDAGRIQTRQAAIWSQDTPLDLVFPALESDYNRLEVKCSEGGKPDSIAGLTLESLLRDANFTSIDLLKVDVEGAEVELLRTAPAWIHRVRAICIEFHDDTRTRSGFDRLIAEHGFRSVYSDYHTTLVIRR